MEPSYACVILDISFHLTIRPALLLMSVPQAMNKYAAKSCAFPQMDLSVVIVNQGILHQVTTAQI